MVAKLVFFLLVIAFILAVVTIVAYRYFDREAERQHEKDKLRMEHTERMVDIAEREADREREH